MAFPFVSDFLRDVLGIDIYLPIPTFGLMVVVSYAVFLRIVRLEVQRHEATGTLYNRLGFSKAVGDFGFILFISGIAGARLFHVLEYPTHYLQNPLDIIFSRGGFSALGGLVAGAAACGIFLQRKKVPLLPVVDATGPALMLGYAVGRLGCQLSGDGDWGVAADMTLKPSWLPTWLWAQTYQNNVIGVTIPEPGVYPTPIYESVLATLLFGVMWSVRHKPFAPGWMFSLYLFLSGLERFFIEKIRVNAAYTFLGIEATQAEIISAFLVLVGAIGLWYFVVISRVKGAKE